MEYLLESSDSMHCVQFDQMGSYTWKLKVNAQQPFLLENFVSMNFFKYTYVLIIIDVESGCTVAMHFLQFIFF